jgi:hypothetical protein
MANQHPELYQIQAILEYVLRAIGISNPQSFLQPVENMAPPPDPKALAAQQTAQAQQKTADARMLDATTKAKNAQSDIAMRTLESNNDLKIQELESRDVAVKNASDKVSQQSEQAHERAMQANELKTDMAQHVTGLASEHALQAKEHANQQGLAAMKPQVETGP